jgi:hypothetical protein
LMVSLMLFCTAFAFLSVIFIFLPFSNNNDGSMKGQVIDRTIDNEDLYSSLTMCNIQYTEVYIFPINK